MEAKYFWEHRRSEDLVHFLHNANEREMSSVRLHRGLLTSWAEAQHEVQRLKAEKKKEKTLLEMAATAEFTGITDSITWLSIRYRGVGEPP